MTPAEQLAQEHQLAKLRLQRTGEVIAQPPRFGAMPELREGAEQYVSPNVEEGTGLGGALRQLASEAHRRTRDFYQKVEDAFRPGGGGSVTPTIGDWERTAEGSSWAHDDKDTLQEARIKAAVKRLHSAQKGTAVFHYDENGPDQHYDIDYPELDHAQVDKLIAKHGFPASTVYETPEGLRAHLIDPGGENHERAVKLAAEAQARSPVFRWEQPPSMEETTEQARRRRIEESLEKAGFKRGTSLGASQYVGTQPAGNIRFNRSTKKPKTISRDTD